MTSLLYGGLSQAEIAAFERTLERMVENLRPGRMNRGSGRSRPGKGEGSGPARREAGMAGSSASSLRRASSLSPPLTRNTLRRADSRAPNVRVMRPNGAMGESATAASCGSARYDGSARSDGSAPSLGGSGRSDRASAEVARKEARGVAVHAEARRGRVENGTGAQGGAERGLIGGAGGGGLSLSLGIGPKSYPWRRRPGAGQRSARS